MADGFEALADGSLLLVVLIVAASFVAAISHPSHNDSQSVALPYAEDTRLALFRTQLDGLGYAANGSFVAVPAGTTVESFLRLEVHFVARAPARFDFSAANERLGDLAAKLARPGWGVAITGGMVGSPLIVRIPADRQIPDRHSASSWTYPSLDDAGPDARLTVAVWVNPPR